MTYNIKDVALEWITTTDMDRWPMHRAKVTYRGVAYLSPLLTGDTQIRRNDQFLKWWTEELRPQLIALDDPPAYTPPPQPANEKVFDPAARRFDFD